MFSFVYDLSLMVLALVSLPKLLWQIGKYRHSLKARLGSLSPTVYSRERAEGDLDPRRLHGRDQGHHPFILQDSKSFSNLCHCHFLNHTDRA